MMTASRNRTLPLAVGLAAATTFVTYVYLTKQANWRLHLPSSAPPVVLKPVLVPVVDVPPLQPLRPAMFAIRSLPEKSVAADDLVVPAELENKVALTALPAGQPVLRTALAPRSRELGLAFAVHPPRRAVTVALDPVIGVAGFPKPGNHVDVLASISVNNNWVTRTVLEDVEVLAMGPDVQPAPPAPAAGKVPDAAKQGEAKTQTTATLAVLPDEAERLFLAESCGKLRLVLRSVDDKSRPKVAEVNEAQLTGIPVTGGSVSPRPAAGKPQPVVPSRGRTVIAPRQPAVPAPHRILVVRGSQREEVPVMRSVRQRAAAPTPALPVVLDASVDSPKPAPGANTAMAAPAAPGADDTGVPTPSTGTVAVAAAPAPHAPAVDARTATEGDIR